MAWIFYIFNSRGLHDCMLNPCLLIQEILLPLHTKNIYYTSFCLFSFSFKCESQMVHKTYRSAAQNTYQVPRQFHTQFLHIQQISHSIIISGNKMCFRLIKLIPENFSFSHCHILQKVKQGFQIYIHVTVWASPACASLL